MNPGSPSTWSVRTVHASASDLHGAAGAVDGELAERRVLTLCVPERAAVVLGSAQPDGDVDASAVASLGLDLVRRRSGGGAVFVDPADSVWIEAWIPRSDPLWVEDVSASMLWLGRAWAEVLADVTSPEVITAPHDPGTWGRTVCFLGTAPGEVRGRAGKIVGISQRRDRRGARLQCVVYRRWDPTKWSVLADPGARSALEAMEIECVDLEPTEVLARLADVLTRPGR